MKVRTALSNGNPRRFGVTCSLSNPMDTRTCWQRSWRVAHISAPPCSIGRRPAAATRHPRAQHAQSPHDRTAAATAVPQGTGVAAAPRSQLSRKTTDPLPPLNEKETRLLTIAPGVWVLQQEFLFPQLGRETEIGHNCFIITLRSGGLLVFSPVARTEEADALFSQLPPLRVEHVVLPNLSPEHWYNAPDWAARWPDATVWTVPGLLELKGTAALFQGPERVPQLSRRYPKVMPLPESGPLPGLEDEVEAQTFHETQRLFSETTLFMKDYRTVIFTDMAFAAIQHPLGSVTGFLKLTSQVSGVYKRLGCAIPYVMLRKDPAAARAWLAGGLARWPYDTLWCAHFDPVVPNAQEEVRRCFGFIAELP